jgi:hypothetical protein
VNLKARAINRVIAVAPDTPTKLRKRHQDNPISVSRIPEPKGNPTDLPRPHLIAGHEMKADQHRPPISVMQKETAVKNPNLSRALNNESEALERVNILKS